jgi:phytoene/squalene synthetase
MLKCPNCGGEAEVLLIDCSLPYESRNRRFCYSCKPEAAHELAGHAPRVLVRMNLPEEVLRAALAARRYVVDRSSSYPLVERLVDLAGRVAEGVQ